MASAAPADGDQASDPPAGAGPGRAEALLRSTRGRRALVATAVLLLSALMAAQFAGMLAERGREADFGRLFVAQLLHWGLWAILAWPAVRFAFWSWPRSAPLALAAQLLLAPGLGALHGALVWHALDVLDLAPEFVAAQPPERRPPFDRPPRLDRLGPGGRRTLPDAPRSPDGSSPIPGASRPAGEGRPFPGWRGNPWWRRGFTYLGLLAAAAALRTWLTTRDEQRRAALLQLRASRLTGELTQARLESLSARVQPHFLLNSLHAVGELVRSGRSEQALATLASVGDLLRSSLDPGDRRELPLAEELDALAGYLSIQELRLGERLVVSIDMQPECRQALVPPLVLLPLVENAVRHAAEPRVEPTHIEVRARREEQAAPRAATAGDTPATATPTSRLVLVVQDDGPGFPAEVLAEGQRPTDERPHIGLSNTRARLVGLYGAAGLLRLENRPEGGARVVLQLPFATSGDASRPGAPAAVP